MKSNKNDESVGDETESSEGKDEAGDEVAAPEELDIGGEDATDHQPNLSNTITEDTQPVTVLVTGANNGDVPGLESSL